MTNIILNTDSYKTSHFLQYPSGTTSISSYIEPRKSREEVVFFGLQAFIKEYLLKPITLADIKEAADVFASHGVPFHRSGWEYILDKHGGYLPLEIQAAPEGLVMPGNNVQVQVVNTDPRLFWLTSYIETAMLRAVWYPSTVATNSRDMKKVIAKGLLETSDVPVEDQIGFKLHDFGARGATSQEAAMLGGMAHLVNFMGTDTVAGIMGARKYYSEYVAGYSIPASEHSTMTAWGRGRETDAYENMLEVFGGDGKILACVSDSYDIYNAVRNIWGGELADAVKKSGGTLVIRPDSGDPLTVPVEVTSILADKFGYTTNQKGYKVLPDYVRVIQGDGINTKTLPGIVENMKQAGFSIDNIAFGMGGGLLQDVNRDTLGYAMKASAICIDNKWSDVYKDPVGGGKRSKKGRLSLVEQHGLGNRTIRTIRKEHLGMQDDLLRIVYRDGVFMVDTDFTTVRKNASVNYSELKWTM